MNFHLDSLSFHCKVNYCSYIDLWFTDIRHTFSCLILSFFSTVFRYEIKLSVTTLFFLSLLMMQFYWLIIMPSKLFMFVHCSFR